MFRDCKLQNLAIFGGAISSWIKDLKTNEVHRWILHIVMTSGKLQNPNFMDLQNFLQATNTTNKRPQPNKLIEFGTETSCKNSTCGFQLLGCKSKSSSHFVWTIFLPCLLSKKRVCTFTLSDDPIQNETFINFDLHRLQLELISFCDEPFRWRLYQGLSREWSARARN